MFAVDGAEIYFEWFGDGEHTLTLVNGYTRPSSDFRMFARRLEKFGVRCLLFDNRGAGKTLVSRNFDRNDMVSDIFALWDHVGVKKSALLGISMGGMLAQALALRDSSPVEKLILVSTACCSALIQQKEIPWSADPNEVMTKMRAYFSDDFFHRNKLLVDSMVKQIAKAVATTDFIARADAQQAAIAEFDVCSQLSKISIPTLVVHGTADGVVPYTAAETLRHAIDGSELHAFVNGGHLLLAEQPQEFARVVAEFLNA